MNNFGVTVFSTGLLTALAAVGVKILEIAGIFILCFILIKIVNAVAAKFFKRQTEKQGLSMSQRKAETLNSVTTSISKYVIYFLGIFTILKLLGVDSASILVVASAGSVAVGLGAQSIVTDMLEGFFILFEDHYAVGDIVTIQNITGTVEGVTLRSTKIRDPFGKLHIIPNGSVGIVTNLCNEFINAVVTVGVSYGSNIDEVISVLQDEMSKTTDMDSLLETPQVAGVIALDDSAVTIKIVGKCKVKTNLAVEAELLRRIKNRLDKEGIEIPFPQRTIHIIQEKEA